MVGIESTRFVAVKTIDKLSLAEELKCGICRQFLDNAVDTQCKHTFCLVCLQKSVADSNGTKRCPKCHHSLSSRKRSSDAMNESIGVGVIGCDVRVRENFKVNAIIGKLRISCNFKRNGCEEVVAFEALATHLTTCAYKSCTKCGLPYGKVDNDHNCIDLLRADRSEWMEKYRTLETNYQSLKQMAEEVTHKLNASTAERKELVRKAQDMDVKHKELVTKHQQLLVRSVKEFHQKCGKSDAPKDWKRWTSFGGSGLKK